MITNESQTRQRLPLTNDYVFKRVFAKDENNSMLKDFLEAILNRKIDKVEVKNPEIPKNLADERMGVLDLKLEVDGNEILDVEMQMRDEHNMRQRSVFYLSKLVADQLKSGQKYIELKRVIVINLLNFNLLERNSYYSIAKMKFDENKEKYKVDMGYEKEDEIATDIIEMQFIELPKFLKKNPECKTKLEQWLWLLTGRKEEKIKMAMEENEEIKKAIEELEKLSLDPNEKELYEYRERALRDYISEMDYSINKGKEEGAREAQIEIARKMLKRHVPIKEIIEITGLNEKQIKDINY